MTDRSDKFSIEEYKALRKEIDDRISDIAKIAQYGLTGVAAIYAWLATKGLDAAQPQIIRLGLIGAVLLAVGFTIRIGFLEKRLIELGDYITGIEQSFEIIGWETSRRGGPLNMRELHIWSVTLWMFIFMSGISLAVTAFWWNAGARVASG